MTSARERLLVVLDEPAELLHDAPAATGAGVAAHARWASRAARHASTNVAASPSSTSRDGVVEPSGVRDGEPVAAVDGHAGHERSDRAHGAMLRRGWQLLHAPRVAVGVAEEDERSPREHLHVAHLDPALGEMGSRLFDVVDDDLQACDRAGSGIGEPGADRDRARRPGRRDLHEPHLVAHRMVVVEVEARLVDVERLRAVDVGDGHVHEFEPEVHHPSILASHDDTGVRRYARSIASHRIASVGRSHVPGIDRGAVIVRLERAGCVAAPEEADELITASAGDAVTLEALIARRTSGEPLAWVTGTTSFCGLTLAVEPGVYAPRPHTEPLALRAASLLPPSGTAVDLCTGTGAIAAVIATARPAATVVATELDAVAVRCARRNGVEVFQGSLDEPLPPSLARGVDVMTAVVPYVPTDAIRLLPRDVQAFESPLALDGGDDGTDRLIEVARRSIQWLRPSGWLLVELGGDQADPLGRLLVVLGFETPDVMVDDDGAPRAICARLAR